MTIRPARASDAERIAAIYNYYVTETNITFEEAVVSAEVMQQRMADVNAQGYEWLVIDVEGIVQGYAYATRWKSRSAYRFAVESTVYLDPTCKGKGLGTALYQALFDGLRKQAVRVVIGGVTLPNPASQALHEKLGMKKVAHFESVGFKHGEWLDVGYWQCTLNDDV